MLSSRSQAIPESSLPEVATRPGRLLPLLLLLAACESNQEPTGPGNAQPALLESRPSGEEVLTQATPTGLRWFRTHTHRVTSGTSAAFRQLASLGPAATISQPTDLGATLGDLLSVATGINASGQLAGWTVTAEGPQLLDAVRWDANGTPVELPKITAEGQAAASDLNDAGVVVGSDSELSAELGWSMHAVRWNLDGSLSEFPPVPGSRGNSAEAINATGVVVGWAELLDLSTRAVRWDAQGAHVLPSEGCCAAAVDLNAEGTAVGHATSGGFIHPAVWSPGGVLTILSLPFGDNFGFAAGINNLGQVVGTTGFSDGPDITHHAVIWAPDGTPSVLPNSESSNSGDLTGALEITDQGVVAGHFEDVSTGLPVTTAAIWVEGQKVVVPAGTSRQADVNDLNETQLAGAFYPGSALHAARWSYSIPGVRFDFSGFFPPVANPGATAPHVVNEVRAGQAVPIKFSLNGNQGLDILAPGNPASKVVACAPSDTEGAEPTRSVGQRGLSYRSGVDRYSYVWKTEKAWAGTCRQLSLTFIDGSTQVAVFQFTR